jgi:asparagine synthetase B (glutamine-hydrolysing)
MAAHGLELRVPFLDKQVVEVGMTIDQTLKVSEPEKKVLREQFIGLLPDEILWRQKNGMSDAVGYNWVRVPQGPKVSRVLFECSPSNAGRRCQGVHRENDHR